MYSTYPNWAAYLILGLLGLFFLRGVYLSLYRCFDHSHTKYAENLRPDAKITRVDKKVVGVKNSKKIRTVVVFEDGFLFESHKTDRENGFMTYKLSVSEATLKEILRRAVEAHNKACGLSR